MLCGIAKCGPHLLGIIFFQKRRRRTYIYTLTALYAHGFVHIRAMSGRYNCFKTPAMLTEIVNALHLSANSHASAAQHTFFTVAYDRLARIFDRKPFAGSFKKPLTHSVAVSQILQLASPVPLACLAVTRMIIKQQFDYISPCLPYLRRIGLHFHPFPHRHRT